MIAERVLPDLLERAGERSAIVSRSLKTWGTSESALAEMVAHRVDALEDAGNPTIRVPRTRYRGAGGAGHREGRDRSGGRGNRRGRGYGVGADSRFDDFRRRRRNDGIHGARGVRGRGWTLGVAESLTGGLIGSRLANVAGRERRASGNARVVRDRREALGSGSDRGIGGLGGHGAGDGRGCAARLRCRRGNRSDGCGGPDRTRRCCSRDCVVRSRLPPREGRGSVDPASCAIANAYAEFSTISLLNLLRMRLAGLEATLWR